MQKAPVLPHLVLDYIYIYIYMYLRLMNSESKCANGMLVMKEVAQTTS